MQSIKWWVPKLLCSSPLVSAKTMASIGITNTNYPSQSTIRSFKSCYLSHTQKNIYTICFMQWCSLFALVILRCGCLSAPRSLLPSIHILAHIACVFRIHLDVWYHQIHMDCIHLAIIGIMMSNICMHIACGSRSTSNPSISFIWTQIMVLHAIPWLLRCFLTPVLSLLWAWPLDLFLCANLRDYLYHYPLSLLPVIPVLISLSCGILMPVVVEPVVSLGTRHFVSLSPTGYVIVFLMFFLSIFSSFFVSFLRVYSTVTLCRFCPVQRNCTTLYKIHSTWRWVKFKPFIYGKILISYYVSIFMYCITIFMYYLFDLFSLIYVISCLVMFVCIFSGLCYPVSLSYYCCLELLIFLPFKHSYWCSVWVCNLYTRLKKK
eukprot:1089164_1